MGLADGIYNSLYKLGEYISDNTTYFNNTTGLTEEDIESMNGNVNNISISSPDPIIDKITKYPHICLWIRSLDRDDLISGKYQMNTTSNKLFQYTGIFKLNITVTILTDNAEDRDNSFIEVNECLTKITHYKSLGFNDDEPVMYTLIDRKNYMMKDVHQDSYSRRDIQLSLVFYDYTVEDLNLLEELIIDLESVDNIEEQISEENDFIVTKTIEILNKNKIRMTLRKLI